MPRARGPRGSAVPSGMQAQAHPHACHLVLLILIASISINESDAKQYVSESACDKPVYLTFDTGHMAVAPLIADVLRQENVRATFFAAHERTQQGDGSLGEHWAPWWRARAAEGHMFASHTHDHTYWRADLPATASGTQFRVRPSAGPQAGHDTVISGAAYCAEIKRADDRLRQLTGTDTLPVWRAPGGKTSVAMLKNARQCGYAHVGWAPAGFLGDELPSDRHPNSQLLSKALHDIRSGDILMAHLGIWSRQDPWAPAVLAPLLQGLKAKGFCFQTLAEHPDYTGWIATQRGNPARSRAQQP
ncbi:MAG: polysaccharide deacetylase family protein [Burkholderiales bacterium]|nr:polysaccharide deacetylase family protein [Burkholderiales bacterium]